MNYRTRTKDWTDYPECELTGETVMAFGKHAGLKLRDIPGKYLAFLGEQEWVKTKYPQLFRYLVKAGKATK